MKKKWYRSGGVKAIAAILGVTALTAAAAGGAAAAGILSQGIYPFDEGEYLESKTFVSAMYSEAYEVLLSLDHRSILEQADKDSVIDLGEIMENEELSYENTSGLAYKLEDLLEWSDRKDWSSSERDILVCVKPDNTVEYMYYEDFDKKVRDGELGFLKDPDYYGEYEVSAEYAESDVSVTRAEAEMTDTAETEEILYNLKDRSYSYGYYGDARDYTSSNVGILNSGALGVADEDGKIVYKNVLNESAEYQMNEAFLPVGEDSILDVLNENPKWQGKAGEAFTALYSAIDMVYSAQLAEQKLEESYSLGKSNLNYYFAANPDKPGAEIESNVDEKDFEEIRNALKAGKDPYVLLEYSKDKKQNSGEVISDTNIEADQYINTSTWQHMVENVRLDDKDQEYVFAAWVDQKLPAQDQLAEKAEIYDKYAKWLTPSMVTCGAGLLVFLICLVLLSVGAGRDNHEDGVQLNFFDRWYTEIAACVTALVWAAPVGIVGMLGIQIGMEGFRWLVLIIAVLGGWTAVLFLTGWLSLIRRFKAGTFWKNSLLRKLFLLVKKLFLMVISGCRRMIEFFAENTASRVKMALLFGGFCLVQFLLCACIFASLAEFLILLAAVDLLGLIYFLRKARGRELILDGLKRITDGDLQYKIPLDKLTGEQKRMAEYINRIGEGLDAAVEKSLKNERMKTELITNVSHDIKTPLTSIINYVDLLKRENPQDPKIRGYLDILEEKSQRLKTLTEDVVEASKASTGNISLEMADLNFVELVHQVIGEFEERFQEKNLSMMVHFDQEEAIICADGRRLWRVLENVFGNVAKYAMENTRVYAEIRVNRKKVIFSLKNISAQPLNISADELTERFIRGDVSRNTEGSGLGLSIAKSLTELQGGEFKLYLDGDLFKVTIVFTVKEKAAEPKEEPAAE